MPVMERGMFGRHLRADGKPGYSIRTPTTMRFAESDGTDVRLIRIRNYNPDGSLHKTYLMDLMGVPFADLPDVIDDPKFLDTLK